MRVLKLEPLRLLLIEKQRKARKSLIKTLISPKDADKLSHPPKDADKLSLYPFSPGVLRFLRLKIHFLFVIKTGAIRSELQNHRTRGETWKETCSNSLIQNFPRFILSFEIS
jgi:hypothetical protein